MFQRRTIAWFVVLLGLGAAVWSWTRRPERGLHLEKPDSTQFTATTDAAVRFDIKGLGAAEGADTRYSLGENDHLRWTGYLYIPRPGNYHLEIESDDGSELFIGETRLIDNSGKHPRRTKGEELFLERGWVPIRIDYTNAIGGGFFDFRWRLPSGYHVTGRVPRVYLRPERPEPHQLLDRALPVAAAVLLVLAWAIRFGRGALAGLRSAWASPVSRRALIAGGTLFVLALGLRVGTVGAQGETCDEWAYVSAGDIYFRNAVNLEFDADQWRTNREHPSVGKLIYGAAMSAFGVGPTAARTAAAVLSALTVLLVFALTQRLAGLTAAVPAGLIAALLPPVLAHANIATLEAPLAFFYTASVTAFLRGLDEDEPNAGSWLTLAWLMAGLAVGTKFTAGLLLPFLYVGWVVWQGRHARRNGTVSMPWGMYFGPILGLLPVIVLWPWLWQSTLEHMLETFGHWKNAPGVELYFGELVADRPRSYFLVWFLSATPLAVTGAAAVGIAAALRAADRRWRFVVSWLVVPFLWSFVTLRQGGYRYVYPAFFPLAMLAGLGVQAIGTRVLSRHGTWLATAAVALSVGMATVRAAPYWHYSFNEVLGGTRGVYDNATFDIGFWAEGFDKGVAWLNENAEKDATVGLEGNVTHTAFGLRPDLRRCIEARNNCAGARDYVLRDTIRAENEDKRGYDAVFSVRVEDAPIAVVYRRTAADKREEAVQAHALTKPIAGPRATAAQPTTRPPPAYRLVAYRRPFDMTSERPKPGSRRLAPEPTPKRPPRRRR